MGNALKCQKSEYFCDCIGTGYADDTCTTGVLITPVYPQLTRNALSQPFTLTAKPDTVPSSSIVKCRKQASIRSKCLKSYDILIPQHSLLFLAKDVGSFEVIYKLSGESAYVFKSPTQDKVYVFDLNPTTRFRNMPVNFYRNTCHINKISSSISLASTCSFDLSGSTAGFLSVLKGNATLPVSITGMQRNIKKLYLENGLIDPDVETRSYLESKEISKWKSACSNVIQGIDQVDYIIQNKLFPFFYAYEFSSLLPYWVEVSMTSNSQPYLVNDLKAIIIKGSKLRGIDVCSLEGTKMNTNDMYAVYAPAVNNLKLQFSSKRSSKQLEYSCLLVNLDQNEVGIRVASSLDYTSNLNSFGVALKNLEISEIVFTDYTNSKKTTCNIHVTMHYKFESFAGDIKLNGTFDVSASTEVMVKYF